PIALKLTRVHFSCSHGSVRLQGWVGRKGIDMGANRRVRTGLAMAAAVTVTALVASATPTAAQDGSTVVRVGVPLDISGSAAVADIGESELAGMELALSEVVEQGILGDVEIELVVRDTKADKQEAVAAVLELVDREGV